MASSYRIRWLAPVAALVAAPACATTYFSVAEAQSAMFPGESLQPIGKVLTSDDAKAIQQASGVRVREKELKAWRAAGGGWFYLDRVLGKHEFITYAVALDAGGAVRRVEILDYRETWGGEVRNPKWRAQFTGKRVGAPLKLDVDIMNLSGATLSCRHIVDGVRRLLATHAHVVAAR